MRKLPCNGPGCSERRIHHENPNTSRGIIMLEVPDDYLGTKAYCSLECAMYDGALKPISKKV